VGFGSVVEVDTDPAGVGPCVVILWMAFGGGEDDGYFILEGGK